MNKPPACPLCTGVMVREWDVWVQTGGSNCLQYTFAWVCTDCSTAFPIAMASKGLFGGSPEPLYQDGQRRGG